MAAFFTHSNAIVACQSSPETRLKPPKPVDGSTLPMYLYVHEFSPTPSFLFSYELRFARLSVLQPLLPTASALTRGADLRFSSQSLFTSLSSHFRRHPLIWRDRFPAIFPEGCP
jgi:hypothetical protein